MPKLKKLTNKQKKYADSRIAGLIPLHSAKKAYPSATPGGAAKLSDENEKNPKIQSYISNALAKYNLNNDTIAEKLADGLETNKCFFDVEASSLVRTSIPDMMIRHKYLTTLIDLLGVKAPTKSEMKITGVLGVDTLQEIQTRLGFK